MKRLPHQASAVRLVHNLNIVMRMYDRGWFEYSVLVDPEGFIQSPPSDPSLLAGQSPPALKGWRWSELEHATTVLRDQANQLLPQLGTLETFAEQDLYTSGIRKPWKSLSGFQNLVKAAYRAQVLHYELKDAFLRVTSEDDRAIRDRTEQLVRGTGGSNYLPIRQNMRQIFEKETGLEWTTSLSLCVTDEFLLFGLCGINAVYRQHSSDSYTHGLVLLEPLELYIINEREKAKARPSLGLRALAAYLRGRLTFGLSRYAEARDAFTQSCECYAQKIVQKQMDLRKADEQDIEKWEDTRALCLRRSALASAMGNGYLLLVLSKLNASLEVVALSRAVLTKGCVAVHSAYVDLIFAAAKRAKFSSDLNVLKECEGLLEQSRDTFLKLTGHSHYVARADIELAIVHHYHAKALSRLSSQGSLPRKDVAKIPGTIRDLYQKAVNRLTAALDYANSGHKQNPRMLAEAYALRSHVYRHRPDSDVQRATKPAWFLAWRDASEALKHVGQISQLECEGRAALGASYLAVAEGLKAGRISLSTYWQIADKEGFPTARSHTPRTRQKPDPQLVVDSKDEQLSEEIWLQKQNADRELSRALEINKGANPRITSICFLRMAQAALLDDMTLPDVWFYLNKHQLIADRVEHAFCQEQALELEYELRRRGQYFFVDVRKEGLNIDYWKDKVHEYLVNEAINRIVDDRLVLSASTDPAQERGRRGKKATEESSLSKEIAKHTGVSPSTADKIARSRLEDFRNKLQAASKL